MLHALFARDDPLGLVKWNFTKLRSPVRTIVTSESASHLLHLLGCFVFCFFEIVRLWDFVIVLPAFHALTQFPMCTETHSKREQAPFNLKSKVYLWMDDFHVAIRSMFLCLTWLMTACYPENNCHESCDQTRTPVLPSLSFALHIWQKRMWRGLHWHCAQV